MAWRDRWGALSLALLSGCIGGLACSELEASSTNDAYSACAGHGGLRQIQDGWFSCFDGCSGHVNCPPIAVANCTLLQAACEQYGGGLSAELDSGTGGWYTCSRCTKGKVTSKAASVQNPVPRSWTWITSAIILALCAIAYFALKRLCPPDGLPPKKGCEWVKDKLLIPFRPKYNTLCKEMLHVALPVCFPDREFTTQKIEFQALCMKFFFNISTALLFTNLVVTNLDYTCSVHGGTSSTKSSESGKSETSPKGGAVFLLCFVLGQAFSIVLNKTKDAARARNPTEDGDWSRKGAESTFGRIGGGLATFFCLGCLTVFLVSFERVSQTGVNAGHYSSAATSAQMAGLLPGIFEGIAKAFGVHCLSSRMDIKSKEAIRAESKASLEGPPSPSSPRSPQSPGALETPLFSNECQAAPAYPAEASGAAAWQQQGSAPAPMPPALPALPAPPAPPAPCGGCAPPGSYTPADPSGHPGTQEMYSRQGVVDVAEQPQRSGRLQLKLKEKMQKAKDRLAPRSAQQPAPVVYGAHMGHQMPTSHGACPLVASPFTAGQCSERWEPEKIEAVE